jgi:alpha-L-rhamnosidase
MIAPGRRKCGFASPLWGCAQIIIPYNMYLYRGDKRILEEYYSNMKEWVAHELERSEKYIISEGLGDWCPPVGEKSPKRIPVPHSSTIMFYEETMKLGEIAEILGENEDSRKYYALAEDIKTAFNNAYYDAEKHSYGYYASNAAAVITGIYPAGHKKAIVNATKELIEANNYEMHTGIYGNKYLIPMLCENGLGDVAMKVLFGRDHFSFGTMMDDGATSLWEQLEIKAVDEKIIVPSYNHPMHSGFAYFYYAHLAGIKPTSAGFETFEISPCYVENVNYVKAETETPYGKIESEITYGKNGNKISITVPSCTECTIKVGKLKETVSSGKYQFEF